MESPEYLELFIASLAAISTVAADEARAALAAAADPDLITFTVTSARLEPQPVRFFDERRNEWRDTVALDPGGLPASADGARMVLTDDGFPAGVRRVEASQLQTVERDPNRPYRAPAIVQQVATFCNIVDQLSEHADVGRIATDLQVGIAAGNVMTARGAFGRQFRVGVSAGADAPATARRIGRGSWLPPSRESGGRAL